MSSAKGEKRSFDKLRTSGEGGVTISAEAVQSMLSATHSAHPREACGILLGAGKRITRFIETRNVHPMPETHFEIDPQALINAHRAEREGGAHILGYFHSHPSGDATPSPTDRAQAAHDGKIWAIASSDEIAFWRDDPHRFQKLSFILIDG